jgi:hypothetical protein
MDLGLRGAVGALSTHGIAPALLSGAMSIVLCLVGCTTRPEGLPDRGNASTGAAGFGNAPGATGNPGTQPGQPGFGGAGTGTTGGPNLPGAGSGATAGSGAGAVPGAGGSGAGGSNGGGGAGGTAGGGAVPGGGGNYFTSGAWHGYAWVAAEGPGSTIDPPDLGVLAPGAPLCVSGTVGAAADFSGVAMLGVNLNQAMSSMDAMTVTPTSAGITVSVDNRGGSPLRLQIQGPNGATDPMNRWCAPINGAGGFIAWEAFNTACWDNSGADYNGEPIVAAIVMVPGDAVAAVNYDFCLDALADGEGGGGMAGGGNAGSGGLDGGELGGMGMLTEPLQWSYVRRDGRTYAVQNNVWGANASQTVSYNGTTFEVTAQSGGNGTGGQPVSYPSVFIGANHSRSTSGSNLPRAVSALGTIDTGWSHNAGSVSGTYNAAYDVWFSTGSGGDAQNPSGGYLMVWLYDPDNAQPLGSVSESAVTVPGVDGRWDVWIGDNGGRPCISYVRTEPITSMEFDLNTFIADATARPGTISSSWYLTNIFAGFEIWSGGVGLRTTAFYAIVN